MSRLPLATLAVLGCVLGFVAAGFAQSVRWDPPGGQLGFNQTAELTLTFEGCEPDLDKLRLPTVDGLVFGQASQSSSTQIVNFKVSRQFSLIFHARATKRTAITIPAFNAPTDQGALAVAAAHFTVGDATAGSNSIAIDDISSARMTFPRHTVWAGEVIPITYTLSVVKRYFHSLDSAVDWQSAPLVIDEWTKPTLAEVVDRGEHRIVVTQTTRGYAKTPGNYTLKPASQLADLIVGSSGFGFFTTPTVEQQLLNTTPVELTVLPLPAAPAGFSGAIGQFTLVSKVVPTAPAVGEPVTWTLELKGVGNWPDITGLPQREVSNDFQVVQPKSKRTMADNSLFEGTLTEDVVLVPTKAGTYTLGGLRFTYFDPASGSYKTVNTDPVTVTVASGVAPVATSTANGPVQFSLGPTPTTTPAAQPLVAPNAVPPTPPDSLPRDPLPVSQTGSAPFNESPLIALCFAAVIVGPFLLWLVLAGLRAHALDPHRGRRTARAGLLRTLAGLGGADADARRALLAEWQSETAALWEIPHAAPVAPLVRERAAGFGADAAAWETLWNETDRVVHGRDGALPSDWSARAEAAVAAVRIPAWSPLSLFALRYLFPFTGKPEFRPNAGLSATGGGTGALTVLLILMALPPSLFGADSAAEAYRRGDFAAAETQWQQALVKHPEDWALRHNLGLAVAQQDRWAEATGLWAGSFLRNPRAESTRWDLALGLQRSGLAPAELVELARGQNRIGFARIASPAEWQFVLLGASLLLALSLALLLLRGYGRIGGWARPSALGIMLVAIWLAAAATFSLRAYGQLADPNVALVWRGSTLRSIPTEADTSQKASALSAGSIAVVDKTFLAGWSRLTFPDGQTGWVRTEDLISLYR